MVEPVTDVEALIAWHEEAARRWDGPGLGQTGDYHAKAATALRTLQERVAELEAGVAQLSDQNDKLQDLIPSLPDGFVAVPLEPTGAMLDAGWCDRSDYKRMLSARPTPPTEPLETER